MIVHLLNSPYNIPQLKNAVFLGAFGYQLYSYIEWGTKEDICCEICSTNIICQPHNNDYVLVKAKTNIGLHDRANILEAVGVNAVYLVGYGMKTIYRRAKEISVFNTPVVAGCWRFDLGVHCSPTYIPLLVNEATIEGTQYPMLHAITEGAGSVCLIIADPPGRCESVQVKVCFRVRVSSLIASQEIGCHSFGKANILGELYRNYCPAQGGGGFL